MNKNFFILLFIVLLGLPCFASPIVETPVSIEADIKPLACEISFDWISKTQLQRDENIQQVRNILFNDNFVAKYSKKQFKEQYKNAWRDKDYLKNYEDITKGKKEDADKYYCGFYWDKLLIAYGIQYKNNLKNIYYYDAMGHLRWVDVLSDTYPKFPYWSYQYYRNGQMAAAYYYVSNIDQYVFDANKKFRGRWFKDTLYNRSAKTIMTRTNYFY